MVRAKRNADGAVRFRITAKGLSPSYEHKVGDKGVKFENGALETTDEAIIENLRQRHWCSEVR